MSEKLKDVWSCRPNNDERATPTEVIEHAVRTGHRAYADLMLKQRTKIAELEAKLEAKEKEIEGLEEKLEEYGCSGLKDSIYINGLEFKSMAHEGYGPTVDNGEYLFFYGEAKVPYVGLSTVYVDDPYETGSYDISVRDGYNPTHWLDIELTKLAEDLSSKAKAES